MVSVLVEGKKLEGWTAVSINRGMEKACGAFTVGATDKGYNLPIFPGDKIEVKESNSTLILGWTDSTSPGINATAHTFAASGRDVTCDLVDCTVSNGNKWSQIKLDRLAKILCEPFGISVKVDADVGEPFDVFATEPGEKVFECLNRACKARGVMVTSDRRGFLVIQKAGTKRADDGLKTGSNIVTIEAKYDNSQRFSDYTVVGQRSIANKKIEVSKAIGVNAKSKDEEVTRFRPLRIVAGQQVDTASAQNRANWEVTTRAGKANTVTVAVSSWRQSTGELWEENLLVVVEAPEIGLSKAEFLISEITYRISNSGIGATMTLVRPDAYAPQPVTEKRPKLKPDYWSNVRKQVRG